LLNDDATTNPIRLPDLGEFFRNLQALAAASVVAFDPFTAGSPFCPGDCQWVKDLKIDYPDIAKFISDMWPGNPVLDGDPNPAIKGEPGEGWLTLYKNGMANVPTQLQIDTAINILQQDWYDWGNPSPPPGDSVGWNPEAIKIAFHDFWNSIGFPDPPAVDPGSAVSTPGPNALRVADEVKPEAPKSEKVDSPATVESDGKLVNLTVPLPKDPPAGKDTNKPADNEVLTLPTGNELSTPKPGPGMHRLGDGSQRPLSNFINGILNPKKPATSTPGTTGGTNTTSPSTTSPSGDPSGNTQNDNGNGE
jgi:hypothetical protein